MLWSLGKIPIELYLEIERYQHILLYKCFIFVLLLVTFDPLKPSNSHHTIEIFERISLSDVV